MQQGKGLAANTRLIVTAVNSHDALVALARLVANGEKLPDSVREQARQALKLAQEEK